MLPTLGEIQMAIENGDVLAPEIIASLNHDAILDARDDKDFSKEWMRSYNAINAAWSQFDAAAKCDGQLEDIRRESFLLVSNATNQHELASYVSDDFEVIAKTAATNTADSFVLSLWSAYTKQTVPTPQNT
ncbi:MAG: hypothetical protein AAF456_14595 [Planctomycetota bacterium]